MIRSPLLDAVKGVRHGFFTRNGGCSTGIYGSLNTGLGSSDNRDKVHANRDLVRGALGARSLTTPYQHHSADVVSVDKPWQLEEAPKADAIVTSRPGIAIAVNTADCTPVLFSSADGRCIAAAHAGWKGAISGVLEATVSEMESHGVERNGIRAVIGPTISRRSYEVGPEFEARFIAETPHNARFFSPSKREGHFMFDLPGYVGHRLDRLGIGEVENLAICTYLDEERFFSYRRTTHRNEPDYGRQMSAIVIAEGS